MKNKIKITPVLRSMEVGEIKEFPIEKIASVTTICGMVTNESAGEKKFDYERDYVNKVIMVERIA